MNIAKQLFVIFLLIILSVNVMAQNATDTTKSDSKTYVVTKSDGKEFVGKIISQDAREVLMDTKTIGQVSIPKHEIREIREARAGELTSKGDYQPSETFATRYFLTTNGLPLGKGESYVIWNWFGPDMQFGVTKNFSVGVISTWFAMPVLASAKYSIRLDDNTHLGIGTLLGSGTWALPKLGIALPFASLTYGNRRNNLTFSGGYGGVWGYGTSAGRFLCSVAGMAKLTNKATFVFDSFIMPGNGDGHSFSLIMPGIRLQTQYNKAFQFGFAGISTGGSYAPIPMIQFFRML